MCTGGYLFEFSFNIVKVVQRKYKKIAVRGKHRGICKLGQYVAQTEKWEMSAICGKSRRNGKCIGSFQGRDHLFGIIR